MMLKNMLFDLTATQPTFGSTRHGGGKYGEIVLKRILDRGLEVVCFYDGHRWLNPDIKCLLNKYKIQLYDIRNVDLT